MATAEDPHDVIDSLGIKNWRVVAIAHALVDVGRVTTIECQAEDCIMTDRGFRVARYVSDPWLMTIDHIDRQADGGSHRLSNLRLLHNSCNVSREGRRKVTEEQRANMVAGRKRYFDSLTPEQRANAFRKGPAKRAFDDAEAEMVRALRAEGTSIPDLAREFGSCRATIVAVLRRTGAYATSESPPRRRFSVEEADEIRRAVEAGEPVTEVARRLGVGVATIDRVVNFRLVYAEDRP